MNVEMGTEAAQLPEKEYINGIFVAVHYPWLFQLQRCKNSWGLFTYLKSSLTYCTSYLPTVFIVIIKKPPLTSSPSLPMYGNVTEKNSVFGQLSVNTWMSLTSSHLQPSVTYPRPHLLKKLKSVFGRLSVNTLLSLASSRAPLLLYTSVSLCHVVRNLIAGSNWQSPPAPSSWWRPGITFPPPPPPPVPIPGDTHYWCFLKNLHMLTLAYPDPVAW